MFKFFFGSSGLTLIIVSILNYCLNRNKSLLKTRVRLLIWGSFLDPDNAGAFCVGYDLFLFMFFLKVNTLLLLPCAVLNSKRMGCAKTTLLNLNFAFAVTHIGNEDSIFVLFQCQLLRAN